MVDIAGAIAAGERSVQDWGRGINVLPVVDPYQRRERYGSGYYPGERGPLMVGRGGGGGGGGKREAPLVDRDSNWRINALQLHREAAELANTQAALENEKTRLDIATKKQALSESILKEKGLAEKQAREQEEGAIKSAGYGMALQEKEKQDSFNEAMRGLYMRDGGPLKYFINRYGSPTANIKDIQFDPTGKSKEFIITYEDGRSTKFKDINDAYAGMLFFMDPKTEKELARQSKDAATTARQAETAKWNINQDVQAIREKIGKEYDSEFNPTGMGAKKGAPPRDEWINQKFREQYGEPPRVATGQGAIDQGAMAQPEQGRSYAETGQTSQGPVAVGQIPERPAEVKPGKAANQVIGRVITGDKVTIMYADGRIETRGKTESDEQPLPQTAQTPAKTAPAQQAPAEKQQWYQYEGQGATDPNNRPTNDPSARWSSKLKAWVTTKAPEESGEKQAIAPEDLQPEYKGPRPMKSTKTAEQQAAVEELKKGGVPTPKQLLDKVVDWANMTPKEISEWVETHTEEGRKNKKKRKEEEEEEDFGTTF